MPESDSVNMICPKCGQFQPKADICTGCGVVIAKLKRSPAPAVQPAPEQVETNATGNGQNSHLFGRLVAFIAGCAVLAGLFYVTTPREMTLAEFVKAKKASSQLRSFQIQGKVALDSSARIISVHSGDGRRMSSIKVEDGGTVAYVTYDSRTIPDKFSEGDRVRIVGRFDQITLVGSSPKPKPFYIAVASSIEVVDSMSGR